MRRWRSAIAASSVLLLDTHVLVWLAVGDRRLSRTVLSLLQSGDTFPLVSAVVAWEYSDLSARGRFPQRVELSALLETYAIEIIDFPASAWALAATLPQHHKDPVDRMLIAHAMGAGLPIATADRLIGQYSVEVIW